MGIIMKQKITEQKITEHEIMEHKIQERKSMKYTRMKQKVIITALLLLISSAFTACDKDSAVSKNDADVQMETGDTLDTEDTQTESGESGVTEETAEPEQNTADAAAGNGNSTSDAVNETSDDSVIELTDEPYLLPEPPSGFYSSDKITDKEGQAIQLKFLSGEPNNIIDEDEWLIKNDLTLNANPVFGIMEDSAANEPNEIDQEVNGLSITSMFQDESYTYCTYGANFAEGYILNIYDIQTNKKLYSLDFSNYRYSAEYVEADYDYIQQKVNWAAIKDNILYVSNSHNTYAKSSKGMNAYITAIDLNDMSIIWRTDALVSNSRNFQMIGDVIVCGYGFTDEDDFLYQIDTYNGKVLEKTPLKSAPSVIIEKDNILYVRTYNTDYKFEIIP